MGKICDRMPFETFVVGVSGGVDSLTLADMLWRQGRRGFGVAHCNFHLRGEESDGDAEFVRGWAESRGLKFHRADFDTAGYAGACGISIEMAARELRYGWFALLCREYGYGAVAIAHNANDNAETLILNLVRGTGLRGICGMQEVSVQTVAPSDRLAEALGHPVEDFPQALSVWRPLLGMTRDQIEGYARKHGLSWREDRTNRDTEYRRNLIRHEVIPLLERLNPSVVKVLNRDMRHFSEAQAIVENHFGGGVSGGVPPGAVPPGAVPSGTVPPVASPSGAAEPEADGRNPESLLSCIVHRDTGWRYALFLYLERFGFGSAVIGQVEDLLDSGRTVSGKRFFSPTHSLVTGRGGEFLIEPLCRTSAETRPGRPEKTCYSARGGLKSPERTARESEIPLTGVADVSLRGVGGPKGGDKNTFRLRSQDPETEEVAVASPGEYSIGGLRLTIEVFDCPENFNPRQPRGVTAVDADRLPFPFILRTWREGDWLRPLGCRGRKKVSDLFTDLKFSLPEKRGAIFVSRAEVSDASSSVSGTSAEARDMSSDAPGRIGGRSGKTESSRVLALVGSRIDESVRITPETVRILRLTVRRDGEI